MIDTIAGIILGIWIIINGAKLSLETNAELEDSIDIRNGIYEKLFAVARQTPGVHAPHRTRIRKLNNLFDINLDIEVDGRLSVAQGHDIAKALEQNIKKEIPNIYDILVHVEPLGNEESEQFGLRPEDFE